MSTIQCGRPWHCMGCAKEMQQSQERPRDFLACLLHSQHTAFRENLAHEILSDLGYALARAGFLHCWRWSGVPLCFLLWFCSHSTVLCLEIVAGFWSLTKGQKSWCSNAQFDSFQKTGSHVWRRETKSFSHWTRNKCSVRPLDMKNSHRPLPWEIQSFWMVLLVRFV